MDHSRLQVDIPDEKDVRFCVLSYEQVKRLNDRMSDIIQIHGRGNFPTLEVKLCDLVTVVKQRLEEDGIKVDEIRLNGSCASSVLASDFANINYNDLDLIFSVDLSSGKAYDRVKCAVLESLMQLLPEGVSRKRMSTCSMKEAYVSKMVKVNDSDRWSLITLGNNRSKTVELKFVNSMRRQYEFSVDSFHILLDTLFLFYNCAQMPISDNFYPTVVGESKYGDFHEALYHLHKKLIATRNPEEIRGGGLLKYCNLLCKGYQPAWPEEVKNMERYMCSRFFIDFPDIRQQQAKLENYLYNHFSQNDDRLKYDYLMILYQVVDESTVCLMGHERRLTLSLIEEMSIQLCCLPSEEAATAGPTGGAPAHHSYYDHNQHQHHQHQQLLMSPMSMSSSSSSSTSSSASSASSDAASTISSGSAPSSGYTTPQKPATPGPMLSPVSTSVPPPPLPPHLSHHNQQHQQQHQLQHIPTYEIVTSCQPAVVYSNGYYYTSFLPAAAVTVQSSTATTTNAAAASSATSATTITSVSSTSGPCLACSCSQWLSEQPQQQQQART